MRRGDHTQSQLGQGKAALAPANGNNVSDNRALAPANGDNVSDNRALNVHLLVDIEAGDQDGDDTSSVQDASTPVLLDPPPDSPDEIFVFDEPVPRSWGQVTRPEWTIYATEDFLAPYVPQDEDMYVPQDEPRSMPSVLGIERWLAEAGGDAPFNNMRHYTTVEFHQQDEERDGVADDWFEDPADAMSVDKSAPDTEWSWEMIA